MNGFLLLATLNLVLGGMVFLLGFIILRENPRQKINMVVAAMLSFGGLGAILGALGLVATRSFATEGFLSATVYLNQVALWEFFFPALLVFALIYPQERRLSRRIPWLPLVLFVPHIFHTLLVTVQSMLGGSLETLEDQFVGAPLLGAFLATVLSIHDSLFSLVNLGFGAAAAFLLMSSYHRTQNIRIRSQLLVVSAGLITCLILYSAATSIPTVLNKPLPDWLRISLTTAALVSATGAITYAIVRHKFLDTNLIARQAILYAVASGALVGFYLLVIQRVNTRLAGITGIDQDVLEPVFLILSLILFQPVVGRVENTLSRLFLRDPSDYRNVIARLGKDMLTTIDLDLLLARSIKTIAEALTLRSGYIVALAREGPLVHGGAGDPPAAEDVLRCAAILEKIPEDRESIRVSEPQPTLTRTERSYLRNRFGAELVVPLRSSGELVGALLLGEKVTGTVYTVEDVNLLLSLATQLGVALQNGLLLRDRVAVARLEEELTLARQIQRSFQPDSFPAMSRYTCSAVTIPSKEVGGDLYDFVETPDGSCLMAIADVSGKGVPAALLSSMIQAALRTQASTETSPAKITSGIDSLVYQSTTTEQFATFFLARLDKDRSQIEFSNAGHNYPLLFKAAGGVVPLVTGGLILGIVDDAEFEEELVQLEPGDRLLLYTDGVTEALDEQGNEFGEEKLAALVESIDPGEGAEAVTEKVLDELYDFLGDQEAQDDVTLMVLQVLEPVSAKISPSPTLESVNTRSS